MRPRGPHLTSYAGPDGLTYNVWGTSFYIAAINLRGSAWWLVLTGAMQIYVTDDEVFDLLAELHYNKPRDVWRRRGWLPSPTMAA